MTLIYESKNFNVEACDKPHVTRSDGGHIEIIPKVKIQDRQALTKEQASELMQLTRVAGKAMEVVMNRRGVDIGRINYQDNGNWSVFKPEGPHMTVHLYGRAKAAKIQKYGQALKFPEKKTNPEFYASNEPLKEGDITEIKKFIVDNLYLF